MTTRFKGPLAGLGWLTRGISVVYRHPGPLLGGAAFLVVAGLVPTVITLPMQFHAIHNGTPLNPATFGWIMLISMLFGLLLVPLYAGYLQVIDAAEQGASSRARDIFRPYRQGDAWRLIGYGLAVMAFYAALFAIIIAATGRGLVSWYGQVLAAQANHQLAPAGLPPGFAVTLAMIMLLGLFMMGFYAISLAQVALRHRGVFGAIGDGLIGALKNVLPLLVLAVSLVVAWIVVVIVFLIVGMVIALLGKLLGAWLAVVLIIPLYIALMLTAFMVMFAVMYCLWRDVCGDEITAGMVPSIAV
jgi:hypothetical protein